MKHYAETMHDNKNYSLLCMLISLLCSLFTMGFGYAQTSTHNVKVEIELSNCIVTSLEETDFIDVFPNPTNEFLVIETHRKIEKIQLFDLLGNTVYTKDKIDDTKHEIDVRSLSKGVYICLLIYNHGSESIKVIVE